MKAKHTVADPRLLEAVSWLARDIASGLEIKLPLRRALLNYQKKRDGRVRDAMLQVTVEMANAAGHPKTLDARPGTESAFDVASRLHGTTPNTIKKRLARKRRAPYKR